VGVRCNLQTFSVANQKDFSLTQKVVAVMYVVGVRTESLDKNYNLQIEFPRVRVVN
jgi:hypothetical protein